VRTSRADAWAGILGVVQERRPDPTRRWTVRTLVVGASVALAVVGCGAAGSSVAGSPSPAVRSPSPSTSSIVVSTDWTELAIADPAIAVPIPPGWRALPLDEFRRQLVALSAAAPPTVKKETDERIAAIDRGEVRAVLQGPSGGAFASIVVAVLPAAGTLDAAAAALADLKRVAPTLTLVGSTRTSTPLGRTARIEITTPAVGATAHASRAIDYLVRLADGRLLRAFATGLMDDAAFPTTTDAFATRLRGGP
jgi:hypothetical protein